MTNKKVLVASLLIISIMTASFAVLYFVPRAQASTTVSIEPPSQTVFVCNSFTVDVKVTDVTNLDAFDVFVRYNPALVAAGAVVVKGPFVPPLDPFWWETNNIEGYAHFHSLPLNGQVSSGTGVIATISFHCEGIGNSPLTLESVLLDPGGNLIPHVDVSGSVDQESTVPPAHTWIEPPDYTVPICVPFPVNVMVKDLPDLLYSFSLILTYDTSFVDCIDIVDGGFLIPPTTVTHKLIDDATGRIEFDLTSTVGGISGSGSLAKITFHCTGSGESTLNLTSVKLYNPAGTQIPTTMAGGRVIQVAYWEPTELIDIVKWPYPYALVDVPFIPPIEIPGYMDILMLLQDKGYIFDATQGTAQNVTMWTEEYTEVNGTVTSWWSSNTLEDGTRACMIAYKRAGKFGVAEPTFMVIGFVTNLLPPEQVPGVDPYIIVNAMPYMYLRFYWWTWPTDVAPGHIVTWPYWWYDSHNHPNWFWGPYWWWRIYTRAYYYPYTDVPYWQLWWGWWWHWVYWRHWYWWSTYFPYDS